MLRLDSNQIKIGKTTLFTNGENGYFLPLNFPKNWTDTEKNRFAEIVSDTDISLSTAVFCICKALELSESKNIIDILKNGYLKKEETPVQATNPPNQTILHTDFTKIDKTGDNSISENPPSAPNPQEAESTQSESTENSSATTNNTNPNPDFIQKTDVVDDFSVSEGLLGASANSPNHVQKTSSEDLSFITETENKPSRNTFANRRNTEVKSDPKVDEMRKDLTKDAYLDPQNKDYQEDNKNLQASLGSIEEEAKAGVVDPDTVPQASLSAQNQNLASQIQDFAQEEADLAEKERARKLEEERRIELEKQRAEENSIIDSFKQAKADGEESESTPVPTPSVLQNNSTVKKTNLPDTDTSSDDETEEGENDADDKFEYVPVEDEDLTFKEKFLTAKKKRANKFFILMTPEEKEHMVLAEDKSLYYDKILEARKLKWNREAIFEAFLTSTGENIDE